jgi:phosphopantetheine--protein transferase-like protein
VTALSASPSSDFRRTLAAREVHLWLCDATDANDLDLEVLDDEERARASRWQGAGKSPSLLGRALVRHTLSWYSGRSPASWRFETGRHGKPALIAPDSTLEFNLSHSGRWLAVAVSREAPVGVDIQEKDGGRPLTRLARRYFTRCEVEELDGLEEDAYLSRFYRLWALKEAWIKARGDALPTGLAQVGFGFRGGELVSLAPERTASDALTLMEPEGYALAVCCRSRDVSLRCLQWTAAGPGEPVQPLVAASLGFA